MTCGKVPYSTRREAQTTAKRSTRSGRVQRAYYCDACDAWHVTSMSARTAKLVRKGAKP
jgi:hypothetical protein